MLLPTILPISEGDEDLSLIMEAARGERGAAIGPAISEMHRRLALTQLVMRWSDAMRGRDDNGIETVAAGAATPAQAVTLAAELARLMDMVETEGVSLDGLQTLVPETLFGALAEDAAVPRDRHLQLAELSRGARSVVARSAAQRRYPVGCKEAGGVTAKGAGHRGRCHGFGAGDG